jgi:hypothetical protein
MNSPFASYCPEGVLFEPPRMVSDHKYKKHAEFALYVLPKMLDTHASLPVNTISMKKIKHRKHRRSNSIVNDCAGILMNASAKTVSFSPIVCKKEFKTDMW